MTTLTFLSKRNFFFFLFLLLKIWLYSENVHFFLNVALKLHRITLSSYSHKKWTHPVHMMKSGSGRILFIAYTEELIRCHGESQTYSPNLPALAAGRLPLDAHTNSGLLFGLYVGSQWRSVMCQKFPVRTMRDGAHWSTEYVMYSLLTW